MIFFHIKFIMYQKFKGNWNFLIEISYLHIKLYQRKNLTSWKASISVVFAEAKEGMFYVWCVCTRYSFVCKEGTF